MFWHDSILGRDSSDGNEYEDDAERRHFVKEDLRDAASLANRLSEPMDDDDDDDDDDDARFC